VLTVVTSGQCSAYLIGPVVAARAEVTGRPIRDAGHRRCEGCVLAPRGVAGGQWLGDQSVRFGRLRVVRTV